MSQRRIRGNQAATVNYKELYEETVEERDEAIADIQEMAAIAAKYADDQRMERMDLLLSAVAAKVLSPDIIENIERELSGEEGGVKSGS